ncbi:MAG: hypothetical protein PWP27_895 [Clostridiales bacterium]|jgi:microcompartment protein CcmL/EutN|nr:hypothetical protein [Clostridiales bacterium]MDK2933085.1 hypothetical protein [Clostridiales bacterium]
MGEQALGFIETYGYVGAVEAADACLKAANVQMIGCELVKGGLVTVMIVGDVSAVKASVDAAAAAAGKVGKVVSINVIARRGEGLEKIICAHKNEVNAGDAVDTTQEEQLKNKEDFSESKDQNSDTLSKAGQEIKEHTVTYKEKTIDVTDKAVLENMKVVDLRRIARKMDGIAIEKSKIKFAKKAELIEAITNYYNTWGGIKDDRG